MPQMAGMSDTGGKTDNAWTRVLPAKCKMDS